MPKRSWWSGLTVQMMAVNMGRRLSSSLPPASASAILRRPRASQSSLIETTMLCFSLLRTQASSSCSTRVSMGQSWALTTALVALTLSSACTTLAQFSRSSLRDERTSPVAGSR